MTREDIDPARIAVVCMGGGYAVSLGARDKRLRAVAGGYDIGGTFQKFLGVEGFAAYDSLARPACEGRGNRPCLKSSAQGAVMVGLSEIGVSDAERRGRNDNLLFERREFGGCPSPQRSDSRSRDSLDLLVLLA